MKEWDKEIKQLSPEDTIIFYAMNNDISEIMINFGPDGHCDGSEYIALYCLKQLKEWQRD